MNGFLITGIIVVAIGTLLMTYGGIVQSRKDAEASSKKSDMRLEEISRDLADLKGRPKTELAPDALVKIEDDLTKWAKDFASERQKKKVQIQEQILDNLSSVDHTNALIREYFTYFITVLRTAFAHYSDESKEQIEINLPEVPSNLFTSEKIHYNGTIIFSKNISWQLNTIYNTRTPTLAGPGFLISLKNTTSTGVSSKSNSLFRIRFTNDAKKYVRMLDNDFYLAYPEYSAEKMAEEYENDIKRILITLIEFQLSLK